MIQKSSLSKEREEILISVIVPVYNPNRTYFKQCMDSILFQDYSNFEILVILDGLSSIAEDILESCDDERIKVVRQEKSGVSVARNRGLSLAKGDYITFLDADDRFLRGAFSRFEATLIRLGKPIDVSIFGYTTNEDALEQVVPIEMMPLPQSLEGERVLQALFLQKEAFDYSAVFGTFYRSEFVKTIHFDESVVIAEDVLFRYQVFKKAASIALIDSAIVFYRKNDSGAMASVFRKEFHQTLEAIENMSDDVLGRFGTSDMYTMSRVRVFSIACGLYLRNGIDSFPDEKADLWRAICSSRQYALCRESRFKVKAAAILTYFGESVFRRVYRLADG